MGAAASRGGGMETDPADSVEREAAPQFRSAQAGYPDGFSPQELGGDVRFIPGIPNMGNTCFSNALLQALASLPRVHAFLRSVESLWSVGDLVEEEVEMCEEWEDEGDLMARIGARVGARSAHARLAGLQRILERKLRKSGGDAWADADDSPGRLAGALLSMLQALSYSSPKPCGVVDRPDLLRRVDAFFSSAPPSSAFASMTGERDQQDAHELLVLLFAALHDNTHTLFATFPTLSLSPSDLPSLESPDALIAQAADLEHMDDENDDEDENNEEEGEEAEAEEGGDDEMSAQRRAIRALVVQAGQLVREGLLKVKGVERGRLETSAAASEERSASSTSTAPQVAASSIVHALSQLSSTVSRPTDTLLPASPVMLALMAGAGSRSPSWNSSLAPVRRLRRHQPRHPALDLSLRSSAHQKSVVQASSSAAASLVASGETTVSTVSTSARSAKEGFEEKELEWGALGASNVSDGGAAGAVGAGAGAAGAVGALSDVAEEMQMDLVLTSPLMGVMGSTTLCEACKKSRTWSSEGFVSLSVPLQGGTVESCIRGLMHGERVSAYRCEMCKATSDARRRHRIVRLPQVLCIHLQRRRMNMYGAWMKDARRIAFPAVLDASTFAPEAASRTGCVRPSTTLTAADFGLASPDAEERGASPRRYDLMAVVIHEGNAMGGHFTCYRRVPHAHAGDGEPAAHTRSDGEFGAAGCPWVFTSDSLVRPATEAEVLGAEAYLLFYAARSASAADWRIDGLADELRFVD
jgi:Ubiquitin carboxyl-terminal hydrolase